MYKAILGSLLLVVGALLWHLSQSDDESQRSIEKNSIVHNDVDTPISNNAVNLISLDQLPDELRPIAKEHLEREESQGFAEVSEFDASEIVDIVNYIVGTDFSSANIDFEPSVLPNVLVEHHEYIGYTHPNYSINKNVVQMHNGTLRRVFRNYENGNIIILEESSGSGGPGAFLLKEAVNTDVAQLPARFGKMKSLLNKEYVSLNWITQKRAYNLYQVGNLENSKETLVQLGSALTLDNR